VSLTVTRNRTAVLFPNVPDTTTELAIKYPTNNIARETNTAISSRILDFQCQQHILKARSRCDEHWYIVSCVRAK